MDSEDGAALRAIRREHGENLVEPSGPEEFRRNARDTIRGDSPENPRVLLRQDSQERAQRALPYPAVPGRLPGVNARLVYLVNPRDARGHGFQEFDSPRNALLTPADHF